MAVLKSLILILAIVMIIHVDQGSPKKSKKKTNCLFNGGKYSQGDIVAEYPDSCVDLMCVFAGSKLISKLLLVPYEDCICNSGGDRDRIVNEDRRKKRKKCSYNGKKIKKGTVLKFPQYCMDLECVGKYQFDAIENSSCSCDTTHSSYYMSYHHGAYGPDHWADRFPIYCAGSSQSPIDIVTGDVTTDSQITDFIFTGYDTKPTDVVAVNNGHSATFFFDDEIKPQINGGGLSDDYQLLQLHFHWGKTKKTGSEHTIDGQRFPMEMHLVHFNMKYSNVSNALGYEDGIGVLGFMFNVQQSKNTALDPIIASLANIKKKGSSTAVLNPASLDSFLPSDRTQFYRYAGSLTTPSCYESVIWSVFDKKINIGRKQLEQFRFLVDHDNQNIYDNYRPTQPLNGRSVTMPRVN